MEVGIIQTFCGFAAKCLNVGWQKSQMQMKAAKRVGMLFFNNQTDKPFSKKNMSNR